MVPGAVANAVDWEPFEEEAEPDEGGDELSAAALLMTTTAVDDTLEEAVMGVGKEVDVPSTDEGEGVTEGGRALGD